jgi:hypothetical protein
MTIRSQMTAVIAALALSGTCAAGASAQTPSTTPPCPSGQTEADLGFSGTECVNCIVHGRRALGQPQIEFLAEPTLRTIRPNGPADGKLQDGDVLVAVDGELITTRAGNLRYAQIQPGRAVRFTVRRNGQTRDVEIVPGTRCVAPATSKSFKRNTLQAKLPEGLKGSAQAWLGIAVSCLGCDAGGPLRTDAPFPGYPEIRQVVEGGPAASAGLREGDLIIAIDDLSMRSAEGGRRFRALVSGQRVVLTVVRDGKPLTVTMTAVRRPPERP